MELEKDKDWNDVKLILTSINDIDMDENKVNDNDKIDTIRKESSRQISTHCTPLEGRARTGGFRFEYMENYEQPSISSKLISSIYIAGKYADADIINDYAIQVESLGHIITFNWMNYYNKNVDYRWASDHEMDGIRKCDIFIAILSDTFYPYMGTFTELGAAIALNKKIYIVIEADNQNDTNNADYMKNVHLKNSNCIITDWPSVMKLLSQ